MQQQMSAFEHYEHGLVLKKVHMFSQAIDDFTKAALDPVFAGKAQLQIALCLKSAGRYEEAVMAFRQTLSVGTFTQVEQRHIRYLLGQTLELVDRHEESLEIYEAIKKEDPAFLDVAQRSKYLSAGGRGTVPQPSGQWNALAEEVLAHGRQLKPQLLSLFEQTGRWVIRQAESLKRHPMFEKRKSISGNTAGQRSSQSLAAKRPGQAASRSRSSESRRYPRTAVRLRSHLSAKGRSARGEGELRDLSPWGCRVTSPVAFPVGENLECCIFPQDAANPFVIDGATVRWINAREFGLSFTSVRPGVQRQIAQLCRTQAA
ncbi:MAG: hypothetical protein RL768_1174 [Nitrospirota bacterium]|jgi:tetratricopeptide (TPR) repeat protein